MTTNIKSLTHSSVDAAALDDLASLLANVFGERSDQLELLDARRSDETRNALVARVGQEGPWVGIMVVRLVGFDELDGYAKPFGADLKAIFGAKPVGIFQMLAVDPKWRRLGIGGALAKAQLRWLHDQGAGGGLGVSWEHGGPHSSRRMFEAGGFEAIATSSTFYRRVNEESGQRCSVCGSTACECTAVLFATTALRRE